MAVKDGLPATDFSRQNREWVKAVAGGGSGGGGGLPEITPADEGKVLTVESGAAAWATAGGGAFLIVGTTPIPDDPYDNIIMDKTWAEIKAAYDNNMPVFVKASVIEEGTSESYYLNLIMCIEITADGETTLYGIIDSNATSYLASSEDGYPATVFSD